MGTLIGWLVAGLLVGAAARLIYPGRQPMTVITTVILGIVGALLGGTASYAIWGWQDEPFGAYAWPGYLMAIVGAIVVLAVYHSVSRPNSPVS